MAMWSNSSYSGGSQNGYIDMKDVYAGMTKDFANTCIPDLSKFGKYGRRADTNIFMYRYEVVASYVLTKLIALKYGEGRAQDILHIVLKALKVVDDEFRAAEGSGRFSYKSNTDQSNKEFDRLNMVEYLDAAVRLAMSESFNTVIGKADPSISELEQSLEEYKGIVKDIEDRIAMLGRESRTPQELIKELYGN